MAVGEHKDLREAVLELLETGTASEFREMILEMHPADIANVLQSLPSEQRAAIWFAVSEPALGEILKEVSGEVRESLIREMDPKILVNAVRNLDVDDIANMVPDLSSRTVADIMIAVDQDRRKALDTVLSFEEDSAGRLMNFVEVTIRSDLTISAVLRYLRVRGELPELTDRLYVVDREGVLTGALLLRQLVTANPNDLVMDHMDADPLKFTPNDPSEEVAKSFERYHLVSAPVVDESGVLIGRITIDDVVGVIHELAEHQFLSHSGIDEEEDIFAPVNVTARKRAIWLGVNLLTAVLASWVISQFESTIEQLVALAVLMPIIASMGGNAGTQTLTSVIRGIGLGTISKSNAKTVLIKEFFVGGLNGLIWALAVAVIAIFWYQNIGLAFIVAIAMVVNIGTSTIFGVILPLLLKRLGIDPALAGGVALTTVTDVVGFFAILGLAALLLV